MADPSDPSDPPSDPPSATPSDPPRDPPSDPPGNQRVVLAGEGSSNFLARLWELVEAAAVGRGKEGGKGGAGGAAAAGGGGGAGEGEGGGAAAGGGSLADLRLEFGDGASQEAHSVVLAAMSPFFQALLSTEMVERREHVIKLPSLSQPTFTRALAFTLGREVEVELGAELEELLQAADLLLLTSLTAACGQALLQHLTPASCVRSLQLSLQFRLEQVLVERVQEMVAQCLQTASQGEAWLGLGEGEVAGVVRAGGRAGVEGDALAGAVLRWLQGGGARSHTSAGLMELVGLQTLSDRFLCDTLLFHPSVAACGELMQRVREEVKSRLSSGGQGKAEGAEQRSQQGAGRGGPAGTGSPAAESSVSTRGSAGDQADEALVLFGTSGNKVMVCAWVAKDRIWISFPPPPDFSISSATAVYQGSVFITGGWSQTSQRSTRILSLKEKTWRSGPEMQNPRRDHGMAVVGDSLYVAGGDPDKQRSIEKYSTKSGTWTTVGKLKVGVSSCGVGATGHLLLVVGGFGELSQNDLIQTFDTLTKTAGVAAARLPQQLKDFHFIGTQGKTYFLADKGLFTKTYLMSVGAERDQVTDVSSVELEGERREPKTGILYGDCVVTFHKGSSVSHGLDGKIYQTCSVPAPPQSMDVSAVEALKC